jgi:ribonuclease VapC
MIVDTSALGAITFEEPQALELVRTLSQAPRAGVGTPALAEFGIVLHARLGRDPCALIARLLDEFDIAEIPFGAAHWRAAVDAFGRYGRGRHPAGLNFGDCLTYAVAALAAEPLLYVGDDFGATDLTRAEPDA